MDVDVGSRQAGKILADYSHWSTSSFEGRAMLKRISDHLTYANVMATVAVFIVRGGGAYALTSREKQQIKVIARKQASKLDKQVELLPGPKGDAGEQGPPGPSTGPAGGALTGNYPDPGIADGSVTAAAIAPNALGGDQINEASLKGLDRSGPASFSPFAANPGTTVNADIGGNLTLSIRCTGTTGNLGLEVSITNNSGSSIEALGNSLTNGGTAQVNLVAVGNGATSKVIDIPESTASPHWVTILTPRPTYQLHHLIVRTNSTACVGEAFRTFNEGAFGSIVQN
ncbi:MAG: hypothetical protein KDB46_06925 [Solirubrobacterales bacterium]|nr:hypothetical protein [Solirubrobacterales bacterium]